MYVFHHTLQSNVDQCSQTSSLVLFRCEKTKKAMWWSREVPTILAVTVDRTFLRAKMKERKVTETHDH